MANSPDQHAITPATAPVLLDGIELPSQINGQDWLSSWHAPTVVPEGTRHGAAGICVTPQGAILLVSSDGTRWELPGGRPEGAETWAQTLQREVREEACAKVLSARLLGFYRGRCVRGPQQGLILVRAVFRAEVLLEPWKPQFETRQRKAVAASEVLPHFAPDDGHLPAYRRALREAGVSIPAITRNPRG